MEPTPDVEVMLERMEANVTRSVTAAVTDELERRHAAALARRDEMIATLERENASLYEQLHDVTQRLERLNTHPVVRVARAVRRVLR